MKKIKLSTQQITEAIQKEILKEMEKNVEDVSPLTDDYWDKRIADAQPYEGELEDIPEDEEYEETLSMYIDNLYKIKSDMEYLISDLSYFNDTHKESKNLFTDDVNKLNEALQIVTNLYDGE